jgi:hypothetical protein
MKSSGTMIQSEARAAYPNPFPAAERCTANRLSYSERMMDGKVHESDPCFTLNHCPR